MRNDAASGEDRQDPAPMPLVILADDDDLVCVDDVCLPVETRHAAGPAEAHGTSVPAE